MNDQNSKIKRQEAERKELIRTLAEFSERLENDPYQPGITHQNLCADDIVDIIDDLVFIRNFSEITVRLKRQQNSTDLSVEVIDRKS